MKRKRRGFTRNVGRKRGKRSGLTRNVGRKKRKIKWFHEKCRNEKEEN